MQIPLQNYNRTILDENYYNSDPVAYPYQRPSQEDATRAAHSMNYSPRAFFSRQMMETRLNAHWSQNNLRMIVKEHIRVSRSINSLRKADLAKTITNYLALLLMMGELEEYERVARILNDIPRKGYQGISSFSQDGEFLKNIDGLVKISEALFEKTVEWPPIKPLFIVAPITPLICPDLLLPGSYVQFEFRIPGARPVSSKRNYYLMLYQLHSKPPQYDDFVRKNATVLLHLLKATQEQRTKSLMLSEVEEKAIRHSTQYFEYFRLRPELIDYRTIPIQPQNSPSVSPQVAFIDTGAPPTPKSPFVSMSLGESSASSADLVKLPEAMSKGSIDAQNVAMSEYLRSRTLAAPTTQTNSPSGPKIAPKASPVTPLTAKFVQNFVKTDTGTPNTNTNYTPTKATTPQAEKENINPSIKLEAPGEKIQLKAADLEISMFHGINVEINSLSFYVGRGTSVAWLHPNYLRYNNETNILTIEVMDRHINVMPHVLQIVEADVDLEKWARLYGTVSNVVSADLVKKTFFKSKPNKAASDDIESLDITLSLKCPLTMVRLKTPVRGSHCKHIACFDVSSLLLLNQGRFFRCPCCNRDLCEADIIVDGYVQEILGKTNAGVEEVTIDSKTGEWRVKTDCSDVLESNDDGEVPLPPPKILRRMDLETTVLEDIEVVSASGPPGSSVVNAIVLD